MLRMMSLVLVLVLTSCGSDNNVANPNNGPNNATTNNATTNNASNNGSTGSNNVSNNVTSPTNNVTSPTNNVTSPTNNRPGDCTVLDPAIEGDCDPLCQTGCEVGEHCLLDMDAQAFCGPSGPRAQDDACASDTECAVGLHCRGVGGGPQSCLAYCARDGDPSCRAGYACVRLQAEQRVGACIPITNTCDAVPADSCADPDECYDTIQGRQCLPSGAGALDEDCTLSTDCGPGLRCVTVTDGGQVCRTLCDPNGTGDECTDPDMCRALSSPDGGALSWGACF